MSKYKPGDKDLEFLAGRDLIEVGDKLYIHKDQLRIFCEFNDIVEYKIVDDE